jgi:hypothetical protein
MKVLADFRRLKADSRRRPVYWSIQIAISKGELESFLRKFAENLRKSARKKNSIALPILVALLLFTSVNAFAQDSTTISKERTWSLNGYVKDMETVIIHRIDRDWITSNLIHNRLNFKWNILRNFTFCLEERNRFFWGELDRVSPQYNDFIAYDNGLVNMSWNLFEGKSYVLNVAIDRIWIDFTRNNFQATVGRQRINWSQTYVWNPNDIFNTYSYFDFDYEEKPGSDAVRLQYFTGPSSKAEIAVKSGKDKKITAAGLYRFNKWKYDFQALAGVYTQSDLVLGWGWAGQIGGGGFKGEMSCFQPLKKFGDTTGVFLASVEYDYTFKNSLFLQFEGFYNSNSLNASNILISQLNTGLLNAKNPFLNRFSVFGNISYPVTPLINISLAGIFNPTNRMYFIIPNFTFSILNNLDLTLTAQSFQSYDSRLYSSLQTSIFARLKYSF